MRKEEKKKLKKLYFIIGIIIFFIIFVDQLTKVLVIHYGEITIISNSLILKANELNNGIYDETSRAVTILTNLVILYIHFLNLFFNQHLCSITINRITIQIY